MNQRLKGAILLAPFVVSLFLGNIACSILTILLGVLAYLELQKAFANKEIKFHPILAVGFVIILSTYIITQNLPWGLIVGVAGVSLVVWILDSKSFINAIIELCSLLYAFIPFWFVSQIAAGDNGYQKLAFVFLISFCTDIFAMQAGKYFGKHKLTKISPKKTVEGSVGGILATTIISALYGQLIGQSWSTMAIIGGVGSIIAQLGDLFASAIKRYCDIKDFSNLIPGHGGILDRFDSVIFVATFIFFINLCL